MKPIRFSRHAEEQARERGATAAEVTEAIRKGAREPAKHGRELCRYNFTFGRKRNRLPQQTGLQRFNQKTECLGLSFTGTCKKFPAV